MNEATFRIQIHKHCPAEENAILNLHDFAKQYGCNNYGTGGVYAEFWLQPPNVTANIDLGVLGDGRLEGWWVGGQPPAFQDAVNDWVKHTVQYLPKSRQYSPHGYCMGAKHWASHVDALINILKKFWGQPSSATSASQQKP